MKTFMKSKLFSIALSFLMMFAPGLAVGEQHDFDITTADANTGATMRGQINAALQALAGLSSGAAAPVTPYPYQLWADTTTGKLKIRNTGNTSWITLWSLSTGPITTVSEQVFVLSGTYTAPTDLVYAIVELVGGGGGGGGRLPGIKTGGGGGGGGYARRLLTAAQIGTSQAVTVSLAAAGGGDNSNGSPGGGTSFGSLLSALGGSGGQYGSAGGQGGVGVNGDFNTYGSAGTTGLPVGTVNNGGIGGSSMLGGGGNGAVGINVATSAGYGGGGGGASDSAASSNGGIGIVIVTEFRRQ